MADTRAPKSNLIGYSLVRNFIRVFWVLRGQSQSVTPLYDAHNHLQSESLAPHLDQIVADLSAEGIAGAVVNGTSPEDWPKVSALASRHSWVVPSYGIHPWDCGNRPADWQDQLRNTFAQSDQLRSLQSLQSESKVGLPTVALAKVGEIGLDRWMLNRAKPDDPRLAGLRRAPLDEQLEVFLWQLNLAADQGRAASIHCIDAWGALFEALLTAKLPKQGFLLHAYSGPIEMVKAFADLGAYFSFNGSYLDPKRTNQRETFKSVPMDRLLIETDAPSMPMRNDWNRHNLSESPDGSPLNHPANIGGIYEGLADFLAQPLDALTLQVAQNFQTLFIPTKV